MKNYKKNAGVRGVAERPRLSVFRSNTCLYVQLIDDDKGKTLLSCNSFVLSDEKEHKRGHVTVEMARQLGNKVAELAMKNNITKIVFDRGCYLYHGRIKALADGAREGGLIF